MAWILAIVAVIVLGALLWWAFGASPTLGSMSSGKAAGSTTAPGALDVVPLTNPDGSPLSTAAQALEDWFQAQQSGVPYFLANPSPPTSIDQAW